jgi:alpha-galactosidase
VPAIDDDHVGEYLPWAAGLIGTAGYDFEGHERRASAAVDRIEAWGSGALPVEPLLESPSADAVVGLSAAAIVADIVAGRTRRHASFILPNAGSIERLPDDAVVEVPGLVDAGVAQGVAVGALPEPIAAFIRHELSIQELAVEAAVQGSRRLALQALLLDPVVHDARAAERFLDDILREHRDRLSRF